MHRNRSSFGAARWLAASLLAARRQWRTGHNVAHNGASLAGAGTRISRQLTALFCGAVQCRCGGCSHSSAVEGVMLTAGAQDRTAPTDCPRRHPLIVCAYARGTKNPGTSCNDSVATICNFMILSFCVGEEEFFDILTARKTLISIYFRAGHKLRRQTFHQE